ncbi:DUF4279 domain-containing protein [Methylobacter sp.]|uniref:DUF4279 domain-containing protein n=1 Tax=Methylobacter sp. TaxID=2051955 RepID=UPI002FDE6464
MATSEKESKVTLRISSSVHSLLEIIDIIKEQPSKGHEKGELVSAKSLTPRYREESLWFLDSGLSKSSTIDEHLLKICEFIDAHFDNLKSLASIGCDISLYCCFTTFNGQGGFVLTNEVIKKFSALPIDIVFDFYSIDS